MHQAVSSVRTERSDMPIEWKDVQKWISDTTNVAVWESRELARKGKIQYDIIGLRHHLSDTVTELGGLVYQLLEKDKNCAIAEEAKVIELTGKIHKLELELKRKERERDTRKES
jgi:hypothetical protein